MNAKNISGEMAGKAMTGKHTAGKKKFLILALLLLVALSFFLDQFWSCTVCVLGKVVASAVVVLLLVLSKALTGLAGTHFLL